MLDIKFIRENPDIVKENIKKKFQDEKLPLVDEVIELDSQRRANIQEADQLRSDRNRLSKQVGMLMGQAKKDPSKLEEAEAVKAQVKADADRLAQLEEMEEKLSQQGFSVVKDRNYSQTFFIQPMDQTKRNPQEGDFRYEYSSSKYGNGSTVTVIGIQDGDTLRFTGSAADCNREGELTKQEFRE